MKRLFVLALAVVMVAAFAVPASAVELKFGGYFENVFSYYQNLAYQEGLSGQGTDYSQVRLRNRMYFNALVHENLKVITKFEMDTTWGETKSTGFGNVGADGKQLEVKNAYIDFNAFNSRFEIGTQGYKLLRGFVMNDDASGLKYSFRGMDNIIPSFQWFRLYDGDKVASDDGQDTDMFTVLANIKTGNMQFVPTISYLMTNSGGYTAPEWTTGEPAAIYFVGIDWMAKFDAFDVAVTGIYEGGSMSDTMDISAFLVNAKFGFKLGSFKIKAEGLYATGEEAAVNGDYDGFWLPNQSGSGASYSTSELYRKGWDWTKVPNGPAGTGQTAPNGNAVENRMEFGLGADWNVNKSWKILFDYWYLSLAEDAANGNSDIGNEFDLRAQWKIMKNLGLDLVGAYLLTGDALNPSSTVEAEDAFELSARIKVSY